jgi:phosphoglucomutase
MTSRACMRTFSRPHPCDLCRYNTQNGGPAPEAITNAIFDKTKSISNFKILADFPDVDLSVIGRTVLTRPDAGTVVVTVVAVVTSG